ncbi:MAG TPA: HAMP domain-containing sensor histidine kinase [Candidatus Solibacter sp.]|jgi:two-component system OmpR family sensor kinase|nr:HAMP domain-containing sensor histidine kinase [Candidatus Solibacter sp.]
MSLRTRLSVLTIGLLLALLVAGGIFQYFALGQYLFRDGAQALGQRYDQTLRDLALRGRACAAAGQLASGTGAGATAGTVGSRPSPLISGGQVTPAAADCIVRAAGGPLVTAAVIDAGGGVISSAPDGASPPTLAAADYAGALNGRANSYYLVGGGSDEQLVVLRVLGSRVGRRLGVVQLSESTSALRQTQTRLLTILAIATGALMLLAAVLLPLLVRRALAPLHRVTEASAELAAGNFTKRVDEPPTKDELGKLARSFNQMASAVQRAFAIRAESEAGMRHFVGDASHELRTPLTTLQGQLDLLERGAADDPTARQESLRSMHREVRRMSSLVEDLLTLTRLEGGGAAAAKTREPVDLDALISDTVDEQSVRAPGQQVEIELASPGQVRTLGDPDQLRRAVLNLANNALAHAPGGVHTWRSSADQNRVVVSLSDQGPGIPAEALPRLFDRFYRVPAPGTSANGNGSGLGLAIVKSIVEAHGGSIEASSGPSGATITMRLPRATTPS